MDNLRVQVESTKGMTPEDFINKLEEQVHIIAGFIDNKEPSPPSDLADLVSEFYTKMITIVQAENRATQCMSVVVDILDGKLDDEMIKSVSRVVEIIEAAVYTTLCNFATSAKTVIEMDDE